MPDIDRLADKKLAAHVADGGRLRALLLELWQRTRMDWGFVTDRLSTTFRKETWIGAHDRRFIGETLYGLVRHMRRVNLALERGTKAKRTPRDLERLLALLVLDGLITPERAAREEPGIDWRAVAGVDEVIAKERKLVTRIALAASLPDWLAQRLVTDWGDEAEALALALNQRAPMTVRANTLMVDRDALAAELAREQLRTVPAQWSDTALHIESRTNLFGTQSFKRGAMEAQDEGSQLLALLATVGLATKSPTVVDLCAGAGGKTLAIAAQLGNRGRIVATDVDTRKLDELRKRARRATVSNTRAVGLDAEWRARTSGGPTVGQTGWPEALDELRGKADVVFVDAPCSGVGALRRNPEARWRMREEDLATFAARQREILEGARHLLAPGGRLVYGTCTLLAVENEDVVASLVAAHDDLARVPVGEIMGRTDFVARDGTSFVTTPHKHGTDGFYAAVLVRR